MQRRSTRRVHASLFASVAVILAFAAFGAALRAPFDFDDMASLVHNPSVRRVWPPSIALSPPANGSPVAGRPIVNYSFALNYSLNRRLGIRDNGSLDDPAEPISFHAVNILIHACTAMLLFGIVARTMRGPRIPHDWRPIADTVAAVAAILWLVHPLQTEAVSYLSQRTELLVSFFYAAVLYASIRAWGDDAPQRGSTEQLTHGPRLGWVIVAFFAALLGMASKEVMVTVPVIVVLYDLAFRADSWRDLLNAEKGFRARRTLYFALCGSLVVAAGEVLAGSRGESVTFHGNVTWTQYALSQGWAVSHYLRLVLWPNALSYDYGQAPILGWRTIPGAVLLALLLAGTMFAWARSELHWLGFTGAWFFLLLAPSSSVVPIQTEIAAERRVYLAAFGVIVALVVAAEFARRRLAVRWHWLQHSGLIVSVLAVLSCVLGATAFHRSSMYLTPESLWGDAAAKVPTNARAFDNLAAAELRELPPRVASAETLLVHAVAIDSRYVPAVTRLATIAVSQDRLAEAEVLLKHSLQLAPRDSAATAELGRVLLGIGKPDSALPYLLHVAASAPGSSSFADLGSAYLSLGQLPEATQTLRRAVAVDSFRVDALSNLGAALVEQDSGATAIPVLERAVSRERRESAAFDLSVLGVAYAQAGRAQDAAAAESLATSTAGENAAIFVFAGRALLRIGQPRRALPLLERALRMTPTDIQAATRLAIARAGAGDRPGAARLLRAVLRAAPTYSFARRIADSLSLVAQP